METSQSIDSGYYNDGVAIFWKSSIFRYVSATLASPHVVVVIEHISVSWPLLHSKCPVAQLSQSLTPFLVTSSQLLPYRGSEPEARRVAQLRNLTALVDAQQMAVSRDIDCCIICGATMMSK